MTTSTTLDNLRSADVFTVFADSNTEAITAANKAMKIVGFQGDPQLGTILGRDGQARHMVRVWKSLPSSTDASGVLGI